MDGVTSPGPQESGFSSGPNRSPFDVAMPSTSTAHSHIASHSEGSVRSRAKVRQNHNGWYLMDVEEPLHLVGWRET
jgi:hypothetical protein